MNRFARITIAALALLLLVAGTAWATHAPIVGQNLPLAASHSPSGSSEDKDASESPEAEDKSDATDQGAQLTDDHAQQLVGLLKDAGIDATTDDLKALAAKYGVGGAVRLEAWAAASGKTTDELGAMFDSGMGWGQIARQLEQADSSLDLSPGIGWIMGHGHGHDHQSSSANAAHGQGKGNPHSSS